MIASVTPKATWPATALMLGLVLAAVAFPAAANADALRSPTSLAIDAAGDVVVADTGNERIQEFSSTGGFIRKWGKHGSGDSEFFNPRAVATDAAGHIFVANTDSSRIQEFDASGNFIRRWGTYGDGEGQFANPRGIATDAAGNVFVADSYNHRIQVFDSSGTFIRKWGSFGSGDGQFGTPVGIATDAAGHVFVADSDNNRIQVFDSSGTFIRKWGSSGSGHGQFLNPRGVATDPAGNVFVADTDNSRIQAFGPSGTFIRTWGSAGNGEGQFRNPNGVATDAAGTVFVADTGNDRIQKFVGSATFLRTFGSSGSGDGQFNQPLGIATDAAGNVFVADSDNNRIQVFDSSGTFIRKWGSTAPARPVRVPLGIATDAAGNVFVVDTYNHRVQVFSSSGAFIREWGAPRGDQPFKTTSAIATDPAGNVFVADMEHNKVGKFSSSGQAKCCAMSNTRYGQISEDPRAVAADTTGHVFVAVTPGKIQVYDSTAGRFIRQWPGGGPIATDAGRVLTVTEGEEFRTSQIAEFDSSGTLFSTWGNGRLGEFVGGIATDAAGHVFVADTLNDRIQQFGRSWAFAGKWDGTGPGVAPNLKIKHLRLRPDRFRVSPESARVGRDRHPSRGSTINLRLNTKGLVHFGVRRRGADQPRHPAHHRRGFNIKFGAGANSVEFSGRLHGRSLKPGRYFLHARAVSASGTRFRRVSAPFRIAPG